ncbi:MAG: hypothetical protein ACXVA2_15810, partial [Mucilaginibacter sp.]
MKALFLSISIISLFSITSLKAQNKAQQDNNRFIAVVQTVAANHQTHYKLTNNNSVSMDFSLYKEMKTGSWDVTHHLDLKPGETYEDITGFTGLTGKYVVFSAQHSDMADFPASRDIPALAIQGPPMPLAPDPAAPATTTAPSKTDPLAPATTPASTRPDPLA